MSRRKPEVPSLADALAKGFAELKKDDENALPLDDEPIVTEVQESNEIDPSQKPQYGRPAQHKGQESSFVFTPETTPSSENLESDVIEKPDSPRVEVLDKPSTSLGDDFDVEW